MLKEILLGKIIPLPNYRQINAGELPKEFVDSIRKNGVQQSVLVRPHPKKKDYYQLVAGRRRFTAAQTVKLKSIPCNIKKIADADVIKEQVTENLHRENPHPMDEAIALEQYREHTKCSIKDLAALVSKSERYIAYRLSLNNLEAGLQKKFIAGQFQLAIAEELSKLTPEQQKKVAGQRSQWELADLKRWINTNILCSLSVAKWALDDVALVPKAGACSTCTKKTSCHGLLFEIKSGDDKCLDATCFENKSKAWLIHQIENLLIKQPDYYILVDTGWTSDKDVLNAAKKSVAKIAETKYGSGDFSENKWGNYNNAVKGLWINGNNAGSVKTVYFKGAEKKANVPAAAQITNIQQRLVSQKNKDECELYSLVLKELTNQWDDKVTKVDAGGLLTRLHLYMEVRYNDEFLRQLGIADFERGDVEDGSFIKKLLSLTPAQVESMALQIFISDKKSGDSIGAVSRLVFLEAARVHGVDVEKLKTPFNEKQLKRSITAEKQIAELQKLLDEKKADKKKPAAV
jgi:ParB/RepB/Spo0J family partition protein